MSPGANNEGFVELGRSNGAGVLDGDAVENVVIAGAGPAGLMLA